jgi:arylsulfatase A-like enzyme
MTPNILLITTDQQRYDHLGIAGVRGIDTPNLDRLGREGVHFDRAYTCCPICTPARVTLLTGQYPSVHRAWSIGVTPDPFPSPTIADILGAAGYATALLGKAHFVRRDDEASHYAGVDDPSPEFFRTHSGPYLGFDYVQTSRGHTTNGTPNMHYQTFLEEKGVDYSKWYPDVYGLHDHGATGLWNIPAEYHDTTWVTDNTIRWIEERTEAASNGPWFAWASYQDPHEPFLCPDPWYSSVRMEEVELYEGYREGEFQDKPRFYNEAYEAGFKTQPGGQHPRTDIGCWESFNDGNGIPSAFNRQDLAGREREALQATLGMVRFVDHGVGRLLETLERLGQVDNTVIIFTTDHGEIHGHHGLWHKGLFTYEDNQRIPLLIWGPGTVAPQATVQSLANLVDIPRTVLSLVGIEAPQGMQGADLTPVLKGTADSVQDATIVELAATKNVYQQTMITSRHKLVVYRDFDEGELYDLAEDPDQYVNLWDAATHRELKSELMHRFLQLHMKREGDGQPRQSFA